MSITPEHFGAPITGENYTLECSAGGAIATFEWFGPLNGNTSIVSSNFINVSSKSSTSQLQFRPLQSLHNGSYTCRATTNEDTLSSEPIEISVNGNPYLSIPALCIYSFMISYSVFFLQLLRYPSRSLRVLMVQFPLQGKIMTLFVMYLELKISILSSLISGEGLIVIALKLGPILVLSHSPHLEFLIWGIILAWLPLLLTTSWEILLQFLPK